MSPLSFMVPSLFKLHYCSLTIPFLRLKEGLLASTVASVRLTTKILWFLVQSFQLKCLMLLCNSVLDDEL
ncbi:hypothetical protein POPTR_001G015801v4 [Populus trichocarpa]|uniref:Uncharacterized protein n=1 Tax=Populus trichocarpa TaxID=3694 RepID=A0ACC0TGN2_POPTR|nr:hypothetical protein POPTR_001G015801v4 [Populus trichocarpa]